MIAISASTNWETLLLFRFLAGLAIGALVPSLSVIVVEFSNETRGNFFLACVHIGFAIGAMIGAAIGAALLGAHGWRRDRKSVGSGNRVSVRVDLGGGRYLKKKKMR